MSFGIIAAVGFGASTATAVGIGAATLGTVGSIIGGNKQAKALEKSTAQSTGIQRDQLDFEQQRYQDWKDVYGSLQEDIGTYYKNVTGEQLSAKQIEEIQLGSQSADKQITQTLAQRGISGSGLEAGLISSNIYNTELAKADVRANADELANERKMKFLALGLGQGQAIAGNIGNVSTNLAQTVGNAGVAQANIIGNTTGQLTGIAGYTGRMLSAGSAVPSITNNTYDVLDNF